MPIAIQEKIQRYKNWEDAHTSLVGKLLLIQGLKDIGLPTIDLSILKYNQYGRPYISKKIDFNISHTQTLVMCAINTNGDVGIDVEKINPIDKTDFYDCWTPKETEVIYKDTTDYYTFYNYWTKKEALVKAIGDGLNIPLKNIEISGSQATVVNHGKWYLKEISLSEKYTAHIATKEPYNSPIVLIQKHYL
ncbi:4'-phosphopantetheinyl transferase superfamily protein [Kordia algicida OT-1]|uniref:Putative phosphopantetheinyl transferase n=2 Tax=Kordia TaxID=221065 RepID=A9EDA6_9FLAO|nr:putative phosphopantetheinyl transferase [Kordia algicida OT-1]